MIKVLISACLLGERVRYNGADALCFSVVLERWRNERRIVPFCPEVAGGLGVPRPAAEIVDGDGSMVLLGRARVTDRRGADLGAAFLSGAQRALEVALQEGVKLAILKDGSPSCGSTFIYDGTFSGARKAGRGVTAALLEGAGIRVFSEQEWEQAQAFLDEQEGPRPL
jgi:uncharacterized protein YbbK (DUF523 family)